MRGEYSYVDPNGKLNYVRYQADADGFRVLANNLPVAPGVPEVPVLAGPEPVKDTPEVRFTIIKLHFSIRLFYLFLSKLYNHGSFKKYQLNCLNYFILFKI